MKLQRYANNPILAAEPTHPWEAGAVLNGNVLQGDELRVYYGSGDQGICLATGTLDELLTALVPVE